MVARVIGTFNVDEKEKQREEKFPKYYQKAFDMGVRCAQFQGQQFKRKRDILVCFKVLDNRFRLHISS